MAEANAPARLPANPAEIIAQGVVDQAARDGYENVMGGLHEPQEEKPSHE